ncbi:MAG: hypothetical protein IIA58_05510 [Candidatus Marinimicrobia bacterium]|nr:hypothetical protein [Candidatus Neomarinimicrobiota bacterium]
MKIKLSLQLLFVVLLADSNVEAGSLYGKFGVGERQYISSARSIGMGGINLSIKDRYTMSRWNPALWAFVSPVRINLLSTTNYNAVCGRRELRHFYRFFRIRYGTADGIKN